MIYKTILFPLLVLSTSLFAAPADKEEASTSSGTPTEKLGLENFKVHGLLGRGGFGTVYLAEKCCGKDQGTYYALKAFEKTRAIDDWSLFKDIQTEKQVLTHLQHPFILKLFYAFQTKTQLFFVLEFLHAGDLFTSQVSKGPLKEEHAKFYITELILAVEHLHAHDLMHGDIKSKNILIDSKGHIKLADFGLCKKVPLGKVARGFCGTIPMMAPEVLMGNGYNQDSDWWSVGIVFYELLHGFTPFEQFLSTEVAICGARERYSRNINPKVVNFIQRLLKKNPETRLGHDGSEEIKSHPIFKKINWDRVLNRRTVAPFIPSITSPGDTSNIMNYIQSRIRAKNVKISDEGQKLFIGFDYVSSTCSTDNSKHEPNTIPQDDSCGSAKDCFRVLYDCLFSKQSSSSNSR